MPKVLMISGSPRAHGNTAQLMEECKKVVEANGVTAEIVSFAGLQIHSCIGCRKCQETGLCEYGDDGLNEIVQKIRKSDGLIVGTPVYFGTARGDVMCALQRIGFISRNTNRFLAGKVGGPIAVARRGGQTLTLQEMLMFFLINDMIVPGSSYWNMVFGAQPGEIWKDEEGIQTIRHFADNVAKLVSKLAAVKEVKEP